MDTARIAALLGPFLNRPLAPPQLEQISTYIDLLLRWNARINLTAIRKEDEIVTRHFGESFFLARHLFPAEHVSPTLLSAQGSPASQPGAGAPLSAHLAMSGTPPPNPPHVLDIGSGAGFPALPLKIWAPHIHLTLIESNHKKGAFLREVARALTFTNINVIAERAEVLAARPDFPRADVVTLRAVEHFDSILPQAVTLLAPNATLALLIGVAQIPHLTSLKWLPPISVPQSHARVLSIGVHN
ncbi:MAG: 16S rRNA (guanine(527)-N(7))-methyltransferase RsmG [Terriglobales bacterium]